jgi:hypothetical protein
MSTFPPSSDVNGGAGNIKLPVRISAGSVLLQSLYDTQFYTKLQGGGEYANH